MPGSATYFRSDDSFKKDSCQILAKVCALNTGKPHLLRNIVVTLTDRHDMTIIVYHIRKAIKQQEQLNEKNDRL